MNFYKNITNKYEQLYNCPNCKSSRISLLYQVPDRYGGHEGVFYLSICNECELAFQNPRIKKEFVNEFYPDDLGYFQLESKTKSITLKKYISDSVDIFYNLIFYSRTKKINLIPKYVKDGKLLEIGCSNGKQLAYYKKLGWDVCGIEMNSKAAEYARNTRKLKVQNIITENANFPENTFDIIVMSMVIEHLYEPFELIQKIYKWLKPGGSLFFSTQNFKGIEFKIFKNYTYALHLPNHIFLFHKKILRNQLKKANFSNIKFYNHYFERDVVASCLYKYLDTKKSIYKIFAHNLLLKKFIIKPLLFILSIMGLTSRFSIISKKK